MKVKLYNQQAESIGEIELPARVFELSWNPDLVHQAYRAILAANRRVIAHTKGRGEVRGGGKKPWVQKGTGRARHGSIRSPLWRGGGVTHGPTKERNFKLKIPKKMRKKAIATLLSEKARRKDLIVVDEISLPEPKTRHAAAILKNFGKDKKDFGSVLILTPSASSDLQRSFRNIPRLKVLEAKNVNVLELLRYRKVFLLKDAIPTLEKILSTR
jgi:large subunit ribosomal protein L4